MEVDTEEARIFALPQNTGWHPEKLPKAGKSDGLFGI